MAQTENRTDVALGHVVRGGALLVPVAASMVLVYAAARAVDPPSGLPRYLLWWVGLSVLATALVVGVGRLVRRLLPIQTLLRLSFVLPDGAPSRFRIALRSMTVASLRERLEGDRRDGDDDTPAGAAARLLGLVALLDTHDAITRGHSERVRAYAQSIGRELGLSRHELALLNWAALLHDIGKLDIPREVLRKRNVLTDEEWALIRRHPEAGARLAAPLRDWLGDWSLGIEQHHERFDGSGYPHGLRADEISLAGRIIAVADAFDVITSSRPYSTTASAAAARAELARCAGTQFDPAIVRTFLGISVRSRRLVSGPLAWVGQAAVLARVPLGATAGVFSAAAVATVVPPVELVTATSAPIGDATPIAIFERPVVRPAPVALTRAHRDTVRKATQSVARRPAPSIQASQPSSPSTTLTAAPATPVTRAEQRSAKESTPSSKSSASKSRAARTVPPKANPRAHARSAHTRPVPPRGLAQHGAQPKSEKPKKDKEHGAQPKDVQPNNDKQPAPAPAPAPAPPAPAATPGPPETPPGHEDGHPNGKHADPPDGGGGVPG